MITLSGLKKQFSMGNQQLSILDIPSWNVAQGERIALTGPSGSGKSTLLHILGGVLSADQGDIVLLNTKLNQLNEGQRDAFRAQHIGYIFQDFHLIPSLTAKQNIELVARKGSESAEKWLEKVGLAQHRTHLPSQLSRGQQQRVAIVRALMNKPEIILADEPTGSLDWETAQYVMKLLLDLCEEQGSTLITVTHDLHLAKMYPKQVNMNEINNLLSTSGIPAVNAGVSDEEKGALMQ